MKDREELEFAAKAAGIDVRWIAECQDFYEHRPHMLPGYWDKWNPLIDDGDAFRLAVKLELSIVFSNEAVYINNGFGLSFDTLDPLVATRKQIVRAAAEIGRRKK